MCARFGVAGEKAAVELFGLPDDPSNYIPSSYNTAPTDTAAIAETQGDGIKLELAKWGLRPPWSKYPLINAKAETVLKQGAFRQPFSEHRCLVPVTGFFEWETQGKTKLPWCFAMADARPFALAGFWAEGEGVHEFCVLTTEPNPLCCQVHDRMPAIILPDDFQTYLHGEPEVARGIALLPYPDESMTRYRVTPRMNSSRYKEADALAAI